MTVEESTVGWISMDGVFYPGEFATPQYLGTSISYLANRNCEEVGSVPGGHCIE